MCTGVKAWDEVQSYLLLRATPHCGFGKTSWTLSFCGFICKVRTLPHFIHGLRTEAFFGFLPVLRFTILEASVLSAEGWPKGWKRGDFNFKVLRPPQRHHTTASVISIIHHINIAGQPPLSIVKAVTPALSITVTITQRQQRWEELQQQWSSLSRDTGCRHTQNWIT